MPNEAQPGRSGLYLVLLVALVPLAFSADQQEGRERAEAKRECGLTQGAYDDYFRNCSSRPVEVTISITALPDRTVCIEPFSTHDLGTASFVRSVHVSGPC